VAIPSYACAAVLHAVRAVPALPLLCDIDPETLALDPKDVDRRGRGRTRAVVLIHPFGVPVRPEPFRAGGLPVVEDCAQALGAVDRETPVGSRGSVAVFSFGPTKMITCGGPGGGLASPDRSIVEEALSLARHDGTDDGRLRVNGLMGDMSAAVLGVQMSRLSEFRDRRRVIARRYDEALAHRAAGRPSIPLDARPVVYRYIIRVADASGVIDALNLRGVMARRPVYRPLHEIAQAEGVFPNADDAHRRLVSLPVHPGLSDGDVERVIEEVGRCRL
jgi:perosamine synthetase